jgi:hypothetical protein
LERLELTQKRKGQLLAWAGAGNGLLDAWVMRPGWPDQTAQGAVVGGSSRWRAMVRSMERCSRLPRWVRFGSMTVADNGEYEEGVGGNENLPEGGWQWWQVNDDDR